MIREEAWAERGRMEEGTASGRASPNPDEAKQPSARDPDMRGADLKNPRGAG